MATYIVKANARYEETYTVEADSAEEAEQMVKNGLDSDISEFVELLDIRGVMKEDDED